MKIKKCVLCNGKTNNADRLGRCPFCSKRKNSWNDCICGTEFKNHTPNCRINHKKNYLKYYSTVIRKKQRDKLRKEHKCIWCKIKVKPKITYPQFCEEHKAKNKKIKGDCI